MISEDDPRWDAATMGNRTGYRWQDGWYYVNGRKDHYVGPKTTTGMTPRDLGKVAKASAKKAADEIAIPQRQPATVVKYVNVTTDANPPHAVVRFDGAPADVTEHVLVRTGSLAPGDRVTVQFEPPQGMAVVGKIGDTLVPVARITNSCGGGDT